VILEAEMRRWKAEQKSMNAVFDKHPQEATYILIALMAGRIDGSGYCPDCRTGCCCLFGTIGLAKRKEEVGIWAAQEAERYQLKRMGEAEILFFGISHGDTPQNNTFARRAARLIKLWMARNGRLK
jgi:hypothetical protein